MELGKPRLSPFLSILKIRISMPTLQIFQRNKISDVMLQGEKIGIGKIRIRRAGTFSTTILQTVERANILLQDWQRCATGQVNCEFEVIFVDGYILRGNIYFNQKTVFRVSLRKHLETMCVDMVLPGEENDLSNPAQQRFLDIY